MNYEHEQRLKRLARFTENGNKTLQSVFKGQNMRFYTYIQNAENVVLEWRYDVIIEGSMLAIKLILNTNCSESYPHVKKQTNLFRYLD